LHDLHIWTFGRNGHLTRELRRVAKSPFFEITVILRGPYGDRNPIDKVALQNEVPENVWPAPNEEERRPMDRQTG
jgi:hypothetical protein